MNPNTSDQPDEPVTPESNPTFGPTNESPNNDVLFPGTPEPVADPAVAPIGTTNSESNTELTPEPKKSNKKLIMILGIVGGVVLLAIVAAVLYFLLMMVSAKDYQEAAKQFNVVSSANTKLTSSVTSVASDADGTDDEFNASIKEAKASVSSLKDENKKLGELKAIRVGDAAPLYKTFDGKLTTYLSYADELITSVDKARPALLSCNEKATGEPAARIAVVKKCATDLEAVKDVPNAEFKTFLTASAEARAKFAKTYESISLLTSPFGAQFDEYKKLQTELYASQSELTAAQKTLTESLNKRDAEVSVKDSANALSKLLTEKQRS